MEALVQQHITQPAIQKKDKGPFFGTQTIQRKLSIGSSNDAYEVEADAMADKVVGMSDSQVNTEQHSGPLVQRKCAACEEETVQKKSLATEITPMVQRKSHGAEGGRASETLTQQIDSSRGGGQAMDKDTQGFMESRFGTDFSGVCIHTGTQAVQMSRDLNAQAFTVGNDIYFNEGKYNPSSNSGKHLLAHELTHTVQQGAVQRKIQRSIVVEDPSSLISNPTGRGVVDTNRNIAKQYLRRLCPDGNINVNNSGEVGIGLNGICSIVALPSTPTGCGCLCDMVNSSNRWRIKIDDSTWPHTIPDNATRGNTPHSGGTGGIVTAPSPNDREAWGAATASGRLVDIDPWLILGHELCGHAWMMDQGTHGADHVKPRGEGGHQATVERENLIRDEHRIERRGTHRQPYCGESFSHRKGTSATPGSVTWSRFKLVCERWRREYNRLNGTRYTISQDIPVRAGEILP
ncbi:MAG: DUF4157 domain-containing protein [Bacteroidota bacterium]